VATIENDWFIDDQKRRILFRGISLSGASKVPFPNGATHIKTDFSNHRDVSFIGRPFPLNEAKEHFDRLKQWGFNFIRFVVPWEALEHRGPNEYDFKYIDYLAEILRIAAQDYEFYFMIDPHQDVWSRMTGGDGAPGWIFEKVGLDLMRFNDADCAWSMQYAYDPEDPSSYPDQYWSQNKFRLPCATMFTLFFGGNTFAPHCTIEGIKVQEYLQQHYVNAFNQLALKVKGNPNLVGISPINEPYQGWIGYHTDFSNFPGLNESLGYAMTPFDAMCLGSGKPRTIGFRAIKRFGIKEIRKDILNPNKISCWLDGVEPIWKKEGVWGSDSENNPIILNNFHFSEVDGENVDFYQDYYIPFIRNFAKTIHTTIPDLKIMITGSFEDVMKGRADLNLKINDIHAINAPCWYDVATSGTNRPMIKASFNLMTDKPVLGQENIQKMFTNQLKFLKGLASQYFGGGPTLIPEFNIKFNLSNGKAYQLLQENPSSAWEIHLALLKMYYEAMDENLLNNVLWNYTPDNDNQFGDQWNIEDFSIFSKDQQLNPEDLNSGSRAILGFCRPYCKTCAGVPRLMQFDPSTGVFILEFEADPLIKSVTEIYLPNQQFSNGCDIKCENGIYKYDPANQLLTISTDKKGKVSLKITKNPI
jgi:hypothetical protein